MTADQIKYWLEVLKSARRYFDACCLDAHDYLFGLATKVKYLRQRKRLIGSVKEKRESSWNV